MHTTRRKFIKQASVSAIASSFLPSTNIANSFISSDDDLEVHLFSKHLQFLNIKRASKVAAEIGFDGLDLTVRPKGHILPEDVVKKLPSAVNYVRQAGISCKMITTAVSDASNLLDKEVIKTAGELGIKYYRSNWFKFKKDLGLEKSLEYYNDIVIQLGELNKQHNIIGCYQNHSGIKVGASIWEVKKILENVNSDFFGAQYDIRHAVAEGGRSWSNGVKLIKDQIQTIVLKDFKWGEVDGKWKIVNVPIGEGMVDFDTYFKLLKMLGLKPPVSLHLEYPLGGAEKGRSEITIDQEVVFEAMRSDLLAIQKLWKEA